MRTTRWAVGIGVSVLIAGMASSPDSASSSELRFVGDPGSVSMVVHEYLPNTPFTVGDVPLCSLSPVRVTAVRSMNQHQVAVAAFTVSRPSATPDVQPIAHRGPIGDFDSDQLREVSADCAGEHGHQFLAVELQTSTDGASIDVTQLDWASDVGLTGRLQIPLRVTFCLPRSPLSQCR